MRGIIYLFETEMISGFFECKVYLEAEGKNPKDALLNLAAGLHDSTKHTFEEARKIERRRAGFKRIDDLCGSFTIEPGAADGGVIFTVVDYIEKPAPVAV